MKGNGWGQTWTVLTNIAVSLTHLMWQGEPGLSREIRERCLANPRKTAKILGFA